MNNSVIHLSQHRNLPPLHWTNLQPAKETQPTKRRQRSYSSFWQCNSTPSEAHPLTASSSRSATMPPSFISPLPRSFPIPPSEASSPLRFRMTATPETIRANFPLALTLSSLAGASTGLGALVTVLHPSLTSTQLGVWQGAAAGFMLSVSVDLVPAILQDLNLFPAFIFFITGGVLFMMLKAFIPEPEKDEVLRSGLLTAASISLHNFPEGIAVCIASLRGVKFGLPLALAIGLHNIPEGIAVALPLYFATRDRGYAVRMAFLSGMAEPAGVLFVLIGIHFLGEISRITVAAGMAGVAGVMVVLSFVELIPQAVSHAGRQRGVGATIAGFLTMSVVLYGIEKLGLGV